MVELGGWVENLEVALGRSLRLQEHRKALQRRRLVVAAETGAGSCQKISLFWSS